MPDEGAVANFVYGRYLTCLVPVLFMTGAALAVRGMRTTVVRAVLATAALALTTGGIVWFHAGDRLSRGFFAVFEFPEISFLTPDWSSLRLWTATCVALLALTLAALVIVEGHRAGVLLVAAAFVAFALADTTVVAHRVIRRWERTLDSATTLAPAGLRADDHVATGYAGLSWRISISQAFQARNGVRPIDPRRRETLPPGTTLVVVPWDALRTGPEATWPAAPPGWRPVEARATYTGDWVAWRHER